MSIGTFTLIKNERPWIAAHIKRILPFVDEMVFYDGDSTDGTLDIIGDIALFHPHGRKIKLFQHKDPKDLRDDYVRLFNECMHALSTDLAWFLHPDMMVINPEQILLVKDSPCLALSTQMRSFGGEPGGHLYEIVGRGPAWKNIYRLRNPDLGAHYWGHYGHADEDVYFSAITGSKHEHYGGDFHHYPYMVGASGIEILHFSDVRTYERRLGRMVTTLLNNGFSEEAARRKALSHPRVTFKDGDGLRFVPAEYPDYLKESALAL